MNLVINLGMEPEDIKDVDIYKVSDETVVVTIAPGFALFFHDEAWAEFKAKVNKAKVNKEE